jgi:hypothetical protein
VSLNFRCLFMWSGTAALCLALVSCGVPVQDSAQPLPSEVIAPPALPATPTPTATESEAIIAPTPDPTSKEVDLWFAGDSGLIPVPTIVSPPNDPAAIVAGLVAGPPEDQQLRTVVVDPLKGVPLISVFEGEPVATLPGAAVFIALAPEFASLPPNEQVLVLGQVVISISGAGLGSIEFVDGAGSPVAVPLPDGRLLDRAATAADYISLAAD